MYYRDEPAPDVVSYGELLSVINERVTDKSTQAGRGYALQLLQDLIILDSQTKKEFEKKLIGPSAA